MIRNAMLALALAALSTGCALSANAPVTGFVYQAAKGGSAATSNDLGGKTGDVGLQRDESRIRRRLRRAGQGHNFRVCCQSRAGQCEGRGSARRGGLIRSPAFDVVEAVLDGCEGLGKGIAETRLGLVAGSVIPVILPVGSAALRRERAGGLRRTAIGAIQTESGKQSLDLVAVTGGGSWAGALDGQGGAGGRSGGPLAEGGFNPGLDTHPRALGGL